MAVVALAEGEAAVVEAADFPAVEPAVEPMACFQVAAMVVSSVAHPAEQLIRLPAVYLDRSPDS